MALNTDIPLDLWEQVNEYCVTRRVKKTVVVELALRKLMAAELDGTAASYAAAE